MNTLHELWISDDLSHLRDRLKETVTPANDLSGLEIWDHSALEKGIEILGALDRHKPSLDRTISFLATQKEIRTGIKIEACVLWDTVSALALPAPRGLQPWKYTKYEFVETTMPDSIKNVFHALALNEERRDFKPVVFSKPSPNTNLRQCWFLGSHSNVGGGEKDVALSNISLSWMIAQLSRFTKLRFANFVQEFVHSTPVDWSMHVRSLEGGPSLSSSKRPNLYQEVARLLEEDTSELRKGKIEESYKSVYKISGAKKRSLAQYRRLISFIEQKSRGKSSLPSSSLPEGDAALGFSTSTNVEHSTRQKLKEFDNIGYTDDQRIHFTVRLMLKNQYPGAVCSGLSDYEQVVDQDSDSVIWKKKQDRGLRHELCEDGMYTEDKPNKLELFLLRTWFKREAEVIEWERSSRENFRKKLETKSSKKIQKMRNDEGNDKTLAKFLAPLLDKEVEPMLTSAYVETEVESSSGERLEAS